MNETYRRVALWIVSLGGWSWAISIAVWATVNFDPSQGRFAPQWASLSVFLAMGMAIAAGVSLGRISSTRSLTRIFEAGMMAQRLNDDEDEDDE